ncbi:hypothetical protein TNCV_2154351 [Trichonephila clavipes]|nr:hypothetical protein TNCV_2154351 [Trichonephila clavipes]
MPAIISEWGQSTASTAQFEQLVPKSGKPDFHDNAGPNVSGEAQKTLKISLKIVGTPTVQSEFVSLKPSTHFFHFREHYLSVEMMS